MRSLLIVPPGATYPVSSIICSRPRPSTDKSVRELRAKFSLPYPPYNIPRRKVCGPHSQCGPRDSRGASARQHPRRLRTAGGGKNGALMGDPLSSPSPLPGPAEPAGTGCCARLCAASARRQPGDYLRSERRKRSREEAHAMEREREGIRRHRRSEVPGERRARR